MNSTTAEVVVKDLVTAGYKINADQAPAGNWIVYAEGDAVSPSAIATFATNHGVTATVGKAKFI